MSLREEIEDIICEKCGAPSGDIYTETAVRAITKILDVVYEEIAPIQATHFEGMMIKDEVINKIQALKEAK